MIFMSYDIVEENVSISCMMEEDGLTITINHPCFGGSITLSNASAVAFAARMMAIAGHAN